MYAAFFSTFLHTLERSEHQVCLGFTKRSLTHDLNNEFWPVIWSGRDILNFPQREHPVNHFTENYVFPV